MKYWYNQHHQPPTLSWVLWTCKRLKMSHVQLLFRWWINSDTSKLVCRLLKSLPLASWLELLFYQWWHLDCPDMIRWLVISCLNGEKLYMKLKKNKFMDVTDCFCQSQNIESWCSVNVVHRTIHTSKRHNANKCIF